MQCTSMSVVPSTGEVILPWHKEVPPEKIVLDVLHPDWRSLRLHLKLLGKDTNLLNPRTFKFFLSKEDHPDYEDILKTLKSLRKPLHIECVLIDFVPMAPGMDLVPSPDPDAPLNEPREREPDHCYKVLGILDKIMEEKSPKNDLEFLCQVYTVLKRCGLAVDSAGPNVSNECTPIGFHGMDPDDPHKMTLEVATDSGFPTVAWGIAIPKQGAPDQGTEWFEYSMPISCTPSSSPSGSAVRFHNVHGDSGHVLFLCIIIPTELLRVIHGIQKTRREMEDTNPESWGALMDISSMNYFVSDYRN